MRKIMCGKIGEERERREDKTLRAILRIGSTMLLGSTVPTVTLGSKGVNAK